MDNQPKIVGWEDGQLIVSIDGQLFQCDRLIPLHTSGLPRSTRQQRELYESREQWHEQDLIQANLPLYWSKVWLTEMLKRHGATGISRVSPYTRSVITKWKRIHGIVDDTPQRIGEAWATGKYATHRELAAALNVSNYQVSQVLGESRRIHDPKLDERMEQVEKAIRRGAKSAAEVQKILPQFSYSQVYSMWQRIKGKEMPRKQ